MNSHHERRAQRRMRLDAPVLLDLGTGQASGRIHDLSVGGVAINGLGPLPVGSRVRGTLGESSELELALEVVRTCEAGPCAFRIVDTAPAALAGMFALVRRYIRSS